MKIDSIDCSLMAITEGAGKDIGTPLTKQNRIRWLSPGPFVPKIVE